MPNGEDTSVPDTKWTPRALVAHAARMLEEAGIEDARRNAEWMAEDVLQRSRLAIYAGPDDPVEQEQIERLEEMVARRIRREPLQYILGYTDFYGLRFRVAPGVLIPRPETEQVVEKALELIRQTPAPRVLDVGTGSGCIALTIKHQRPDAAVYACDVSEHALHIARENAHWLHLDATFFRADVLGDAIASEAPRNLDLVISNPPYIPHSEAAALEPEVVVHEPHQALFSGDDPLTFYHAIAHHARTLLHPGGHLVFEAHADYAADVQALLARNGFTNVHVLPDLSGKPRIVVGKKVGRFEGWKVEG